jgi:hypothetical protein
VRPGKTWGRASIKVHVEISLNERSTSRSVDGKTGVSDPGLFVSEILLDLRIRRWRCGSLVRHEREDKEVSWLSSSVKSVIVGLGVRLVRLV